MVLFFFQRIQRIVFIFFHLIPWNSKWATLQLKTLTFCFPVIPLCRGNCPWPAWRWPNWTTVTLTKTRSSSTVGRPENVQNRTCRDRTLWPPLPFPVARRADVRADPGGVYKPAGPAGLGGAPEPTDQTHGGHGAQPQAAHRSLPHGQDPILCLQHCEWTGWLFPAEPRRNH